MDNQSKHEIKDVYFTRFLMPFIICLLVLFAAAVIIATPPSTPVVWQTYGSALGSIHKQVAGFLKTKY